MPNFAAIKVNNETDTGIGTNSKDAQKSGKIKSSAVGRTCWGWEDRDLRYREGKGICTIGHSAKSIESAEHKDTITKSFYGQFTKF